MKYLCSVLVALTLTLQCGAVLCEESKAPDSSKGVAGNETWQELVAKAEKEAETGQYDHPAQILEKAVDLARANNLEPEKLIDLECSLADAYVHTGKFPKAEMLLRDTLSKYDVSPTNRSEAYANALLSLDNALDRQHKYYELLGLETRAGIILKNLYKPDSEKMAHIYAGLGYAQWRVQDFKSAEDNLTHAIAIYEKLPRKEVRFYLPGAYINLAGAEADQHKIGAAYEHCKRAIYLAEAMTYPMSAEAGSKMYLSKELLRRAGAVDEVRHLEWREQQILESNRAGHLNGVDPDNKDGGKWSKECMGEDMLETDRAPHQPTQ
jgi:hypothetical protein